MAIFEAAPRRSNLTREQKQQAEAAIYGLQENFMAPSLTKDEIERMRAIVAQHDSQGRGKIQEFDLNNPPKQPYTHQEFPRVMYHHGKHITRIAKDAEEMDAAISAGWSKEPFPAVPEPEEPELDAESAAEAAELDAKLKRNKRPR